ncbi:MAG: acyl-CoA dehydratase activase [Tractidigestivibacter sp.]|jgi:predicted CoA-substrate-specific enzyme activase|uniref:acyl-CoA dehydratase activase n=1 Tax=Tractidigestivibacter sp. TaxID=2847320 RepID=UPI003D924602
MEGARGVGIDIGSTATKAIVMDAEGGITQRILIPTGYSSIDAARRAKEELLERGIDVDDPACSVVATGYGRIAVPYAVRCVTEITCHGKGASWLFGKDGTVIDVGGQDTKVISLRGGRVVKFAMNDKCAAGTGRFLEVMADRLGVSQEELSALAARGGNTSISSMCTVFAESEVISLVGQGEPRENIAFAIIESVVGRVAALAGQSVGAPFFLTGGLCDNGYVVERLGKAIGNPVETCTDARYAGAIGAALLATC